MPGGAPPPERPSVRKPLVVAEVQPGVEFPLRAAAVAPQDHPAGDLLLLQSLTWPAVKCGTVRRVGNGLYALVDRFAVPGSRVVLTADAWHKLGSARGGGATIGGSNASAQAGKRATEKTAAKAFDSHAVAERVFLIRQV